MLEDRREDAERLLLKTDVVADADRFDFDYWYQTMRQTYEPWLEDAPFRLNRHLVERGISTSFLTNPNWNQIKMDPDWLFANRLQWGLLSVLAELDARAVWHRIVRESFEAGLIA